MLTATQTRTGYFGGVSGAGAFEGSGTKRTKGQMFRGRRKCHLKFVSISWGCRRLREDVFHCYVVAQWTLLLRRKFSYRPLPFVPSLCALQFSQKENQFQLCESGSISSSSAFFSRGCCVKFPFNIHENIPEGYPYVRDRCHIFLHLCHTKS